MHPEEDLGSMGEESNRKDPIYRCGDWEHVILDTDRAGWRDKQEPDSRARSLTIFIDKQHKMRNKNKLVKDFLFSFTCEDIENFIK